MEGLLRVQCSQKFAQSTQSSQQQVISQKCYLLALLRFVLMHDNSQLQLLILRWCAGCRIRCPMFLIMKVIEQITEVRHAHVLLSLSYIPTQTRKVKQASKKFLATACNVLCTLTHVHHCYSICPLSDLPLIFFYFSPKCPYILHNLRLSA